MHAWSAMRADTISERNILEFQLAMRDGLLRMDAVSQPWKLQPWISRLLRIGQRAQCCGYCETSSPLIIIALSSMKIYPACLAILVRLEFTGRHMRHCPAAMPALTNRQIMTMVRMISLTASAAEA